MGVWDQLSIYTTMLSNEQRLSEKDNRSRDSQKIELWIYSGEKYKKEGEKAIQNPLKLLFYVIFSYEESRQPATEENGNTRVTNRF